MLARIAALATTVARYDVGGIGHAVDAAISAWFRLGFDAARIDRGFVAGWAHRLSRTWMLTDEVPRQSGAGLLGIALTTVLVAAVLYFD